MTCLTVQCALLTTIGQSLKVVKLADIEQLCQ